MQMRYETHILSRKCTITFFSRIGTEAPMAAGSFRPIADLALDFALALAIGFVFFLGRFCALGGSSGLRSSNPRGVGRQGGLLAALRRSRQNSAPETVATP